MSAPGDCTAGAAEDVDKGGAMGEQDNAALVRRAVATIWNQGDLAAADGVFAADYVNHNGLIPDLIRGPEAIKVSVALYRIAFPDLHITVDQLIADGDTAMLRWSAHRTAVAKPGGGDQREPRESFTGRMVLRLAGGQIVESWTDWDQMDVLARLGLNVPADEETSCRTTPDLPY
jgi:predicted ester cyclase